MDGITYEIVTGAPLDEVIGLYEAGGWWHESPEERASVPRLIAGSFAFLVARDAGGRLVGMARVLSDGVSDAYIQDVVVRRELRGHGVGRELIRRLVEHCRSRGIGWIGLIAEPGTQAFYESLGFGALVDYVPMRHGHS